MKDNKKIYTTDEYYECEMYFEWAQKMPILRDYLIKIVNEGKRSGREGNRLKEIGMRPGIPDYFLPFANQKYYGLWIEMKTLDEKEREKNKNQDMWIKKLLQINHYATYAYGCHDAIKITLDYMENNLN